ncbi:MAG: SAM-dependent methyltransferase, partial [Actinoallomurus sp.]
MAPDLAYADDRLVRMYDTLNAGRDDWMFYERLIGTAPRCVADVGCGTGAFAVRLASAGHTVVG